MKTKAASPDCSWPKVWDHALEKGSFGTCCSLALLRLLSLHVFSDNQCPVKNCSLTVDKASISAHFIAEHSTLDITIEQCVDALLNCSDEIFTYGNILNQTFRTMNT